MVISVSRDRMTDYVKYDELVDMFRESAVEIGYSPETVHAYHASLRQAKIEIQRLNAIVDALTHDIKAAMPKLVELAQLKQVKQVLSLPEVFHV